MKLRLGPEPEESGKTYTVQYGIDGGVRAVPFQVPEGGDVHTYASLAIAQREGIGAGVEWHPVIRDSKNNVVD